MQEWAASLPPPIDETYWPWFAYVEYVTVGAPATTVPDSGPP